MSVLTLSPSLLALAGTAFPAQLVRLFAGASFSDGTAAALRRATLLLRYGVPAAFVVVLALGTVVAGGFPVSGTPAWTWWLAAAVLAGVGVVHLEILVGRAILASRGVGAGSTVMHDGWRDATLPLLASTVAVGVVEEVLYRGLWLHLLRGPLDVGAVTAVVVAAAVYALNHLYFGVDVVTQKVCSGVVFGALFLLSGGALFVPVVAHGVQNAYVVLHLGRRGL